MPPLVKIVNVNLTGVEQRLDRLCTLLEMLLASNDLNDYTPTQPSEFFYTSEEDEIIAHHLRKNGITKE